MFHNALRNLWMKNQLLYLSTTTAARAGDRDSDTVRAYLPVSALNGDRALSGSHLGRVRRGVRRRDRSRIGPRKEIGRKTTRRFSRNVKHIPTP